MAGQRRRIGHDDVTAERAVVADVGVCHYEIVIADPCMPAAAHSASVDIHVFAKDVVVPIVRNVSSPLNFRSCGGRPIVPNG